MNRDIILKPGNLVQTSASRLNGTSKISTDDNIDKPGSTQIEQLPTDIISDTSDSSITTNIDNNDLNFWKDKYSRLLDGYKKLQKVNHNLEDKLLQTIDNHEREKGTLIADVDKLSSKLISVQIRLHDYEEQQSLHASNCESLCHKDSNVHVIGISKETK